MIDFDIYIFGLIIGIMLFSLIPFFHMSWKLSTIYLDTAYKEKKKLKEPKAYRAHKRKWRLIFLMIPLIYAGVYTLLAFITQNQLLAFLVGIIVTLICANIFGIKERKDRKVLEKQLLTEPLETGGEAKMARYLKKIEKEDLKSIPWWSWVFIAACVILPVTTIGGVIPVCLAFLASLLCIRVSSEPQTKKSTKFLACLCITAVAWGIAYLFVYLLSAY